MQLISPFGNNKKAVSINDETEVIFVADMFVETYSGGAELTTEALIKNAPMKTQKILSRDVDIDLLKDGASKYWIFGNFAALDVRLVPTIVANLKYSVLEYDYKYCRYRSPEKHLFAEQEECNCHEAEVGKMISAFYFGSKSLWWMSEAQQNHYFSKFPFLAQKKNCVLSSVFDDETFVNFKLIRHGSKNKNRTKWIVLGSGSWVKGADQAKQWCIDQGHEYEVVWGLSHHETLLKLSEAKGFVYLPRGKDTCPRMVIEAKLLGCELVLNEYVQHRDEEWFATDNILEIEEYLYASRDLFWKQIQDEMNYKPTISGYMTTKDCFRQGYPFREAILSMLNFCDEVIVVDGGSTDDTWHELSTWARHTNGLTVKQKKLDWDHPRFAVFDGEQKARARSLCTGDFCWQQDADEIVHENDYDKIRKTVLNFPNYTDLVSLPVTEYWGSGGKVRIDVNPWKWRLSRNLPHITHGIPGNLRQTDEAGDLYSLPGSDGCDFIHKDTLELIPHASFYNEGAHNARVAALQGNVDALAAYAEWFNRCTELLPGVHHYSWRNLERKIRTYRDYWSSHWQSLYNVKQEDTAENNMFFQKPWAEVSDEEITSLAKELEEKMGGWVFHNPVDFSKPTPSITVECGHPKIMENNNG